MNIYIHNGAGHYIGPVVIVLAPSLAIAEAMIRQELDLVGLKEEELDVCQMGIGVSSTRLVYSYNGDY